MRQENDMSGKSEKNRLPSPIVEDALDNKNKKQSYLDCSLVIAKLFPTYKEKLKNDIIEIPLSAFSKEGIKDMDNSFVSVPCDVYINNYLVKNQKIDNRTFSDNFKNVEKLKQDVIIADIETKIKKNEDNQYPCFKERPLVLSLPSDDGEKGKWQIDTLQIGKSLNKFVLIGKAGSGKTIIARRFILELIKENKFMPIYVQLKDFFIKHNTITLNDISEYISNKYQIDNTELAKLITCRKEDVFYIFDGIDEIHNPNTDITTLCQRLNRFINEQENIILTSRDGYSGLKELKNFPQVKLEPITDKHIKELFFKYWENENNTEIKFEHFKNNLNQLRRDLKDRPLFVVLLTIIFEQEGKIPDSKISIYEKFIILLLEWRKDFEEVEAIKGCIEKNKDNLMRVLEEIAYTTLIEGMISKENIKSLLSHNSFDTNTHEDIIKYLLNYTGILEIKSEGIGFVHRSFCEYLSARKICRDLPNNSDNLYDIIEHKIDRLKEPILFIGDILRNTNHKAILRDLLNNLIEKKLLWIVSQIYKNGDFKQNSNLELCLKNTIQEHLSSKNTLPPKEQSDIAKLLGLLDDNRKGVSVDENNIPDINWCKIEKGKFKFGLSTTQKDILNQKDVLNTERDRQEEEIELTEYFISKYPITIKQYASFLNDGYSNPNWWNYSEDSKKWFEECGQNRKNELTDKHYY